MTAFVSMSPERYHARAGGARPRTRAQTRDSCGDGNGRRRPTLHGLENALRGVLIAAGVLAVAMSALLVALGRRSRVPAAALAATQS